MQISMKGLFNNLSIKVGITFSKLRLSPNQWTLISLIPAIASAYYISQNLFIHGAILLIIAGFLDVVDGSVARVTGRATKFGAYLDTIVDRYVEAIIIIGLMFATLPVFIVPAYVWIFAYLIGSMMTTYAKAAAKEKLGEEIKGGILERAERMFLLFIGLLLGIFNPLYLIYMIALLVVLSNVSALQRIWKAWKKGK